MPQVDALLHSLRGEPSARTMAEAAEAIVYLREQLRESGDRALRWAAWLTAKDSALERAKGCITLLCRQVPVRDVTETLAEIDAAMRQPARQEAPARVDERRNLSFEGGGRVSVPVADIIGSPKVQLQVAAVRCLQANLATAQPDVQRDAERYRWLRQCTGGEWDAMQDLRLARGRKGLDDAIDAALAADQPARGE